MQRVAGITITVALVLAATAAALAQGYGGGGDYGAPQPQPAQAMDGKAEQQLRTAIEHAKNSVGSGAMATAVPHLGHALNCIEGTKGKNFNASWGHVCQGQGDGILTDIKGAKSADNLMVVLNAADDLALAGVRARELAAVQNAARGVAALLQIVLDGTR